MFLHVRRWFRVLVRRGSVEREMRDEMQQHLDRAAERLMTRGMSEEAARAKARREFGNVGYIQEQSRDARGARWLDDAIQDTHYAARRLRARPVYALLAVVTLALGVGGTASVYGIARGIVFGPLPYAHERELGVFWKKTDWTEEEFLFLRGRVPGFSQVALYRVRDLMVREGDEPARLLPGLVASADLFDVLGAGPLLGRGFRTGDDAQNAAPVAVLSYGLWQEMGGDRSIIGRRITLNETAREIVGVMPRGFWFPDPSVRVWVPQPLDPEARNWNSTLIGRVAPGHDVRSMAAPLARLTAMLDERFDYLPHWDKTKSPLITPIRDDLLGGMRPALVAMLSAMALILLIACANVAALMLGQVDAQSAELAVRSALGASRRRLTQQIVVEAALIAAAAGALGAALAWGSFHMLARALPIGAWAAATAPDWTMFASAMGIAVAAAMLVVFVPVVSLWRGELRVALGTARTGGLGGRRGRLENGLLVAEVAIAVLIASGAALLARSVGNLYAIDPGVRTDGVAVIDVTIGRRVDRVRREQTIDEMIAALAVVPGVRSVGVAQTLPLRGGGYNLPIKIEGRPEFTGVTTEHRAVTPGYLETIGMVVRDGRSFTDDDRGDGARVVVINEALAKKYFGGRNPIGQRIVAEVGVARIVGVVANAAERQLTDVAEPVSYVALAQMPWIDDAHSLVVRAKAGVDEASLLEPARRAIERIAPGVAVQQTTTMGRVLESAIGPARQVMSLLALLTVLACTLGMVGIYGVMAHFAARRRRDWAIRVALGLTGSRVIGHVLGHGIVLVGAGIGVGVVAAAALTRLLSSLLYGVGVIDPIAFLAAGGALLGVGLLAALVPAWRAGMTDPAIALREY